MKHQWLGRPSPRLSLPNLVSQIKFLLISAVHPLALLVSSFMLRPPQGRKEGSWSSNIASHCPSAWSSRGNPAVLAGNTCSESELGPGPTWVLFRSLKSPRGKGRQPPTLPLWVGRMSATASPVSRDPVASFAGRVQRGAGHLTCGDWLAESSLSHLGESSGFGRHGEEPREVS